MTQRTRTTRAALAAVAGLALAAHPTASQQPDKTPPSTQMVLKGKAPVSRDILKVSLPKPDQVVLPSGLRIMVLENHRAPEVSFQLVIPGAGGYYDPADRAGLASFVAAMMREGTTTRSSAQISEALETMGASLFVSSSASSTSAQIFGSALTQSFPKLFDVASDMLLHPAFPASEWDRYRTRTKAGFVQSRTNPGFLATERFNQAVFGAHPAGRVQSNAAVLDAVTPQALADFHRAHYVPDHAVIAFAGDITPAQARSLVEQHLGGWHKAGVPEPRVEDPAPITGPKIYLVSRPGSVQTTLFVGTQALARTSQDYLALSVANRVLGGVMGRLFRHLREEKGYTYGIGSGIASSPYIGAWTASTSVRTDVTEPALHDLLAEIAGLRDTPVPEQELEDSKRALVASFALSLESPQQVLSYYLDSWTYNLPATYWDTYPARIAAVTAAQAQAAARKYWDPSRLQIVAVGDASKVRDILAKIGPVEVYDADGKPIP
jgi:zinc protease